MQISRRKALFLVPAVLAIGAGITAGVLPLFRSGEEIVMETYLPSVPAEAVAEFSNEDVTARVASISDLRGSAEETLAVIRDMIADDYAANAKVKLGPVRMTMTEAAIQVLLASGHSSSS